MIALIYAALLLGCMDQPEAVRGTIPKTPAKQMYAQSQEALEAAGIEQLTWGVTPFITENAISPRWRSFQSGFPFP